MTKQKLVDDSASGRAIASMTYFTLKLFNEHLSDPLPQFVIDELVTWMNYLNTKATNDEWVYVEKCIGEELREGFYDPSVGGTPEEYLAFTKCFAGGESRFYLAISEYISGLNTLEPVPVMTLAEITNQDVHILIPSEGDFGYGCARRPDGNDYFLGEMYQSRIDMALVGDDEAVLDDLSEGKMYVAEAKAITGAVNAILDFWHNGPVTGGQGVMMFESMASAISLTKSLLGPIFYINPTVTDAQRLEAKSN